MGEKETDGGVSQRSRGRGVEMGQRERETGGGGEWRERLTEA